MSTLFLTEFLKRKVPATVLCIDTIFCLISDGSHRGVTIGIKVRIEEIMNSRVIHTS